MTRTTVVPWWARLVLWTRPLAITRWDVGNGEMQEMHSKKLGRKTYILKLERYTPPPEHFNCRCAVDWVKDKNDGK